MLRARWKCAGAPRMVPGKRTRPNHGHDIVTRAHRWPMYYFPPLAMHTNALETDMPILAKVGGLAILAGAGAAVFFFGGYYRVAGTAEDPASVTWATTG